MPEALERADAGRRAEADRHGQRRARRGRARRAGRHHLHRRDRQDRRARRRRTAPTSAAKACSATSCRSSKARRSTRSTGWCKTDHILFIAAGAFHVSKPSDLIPGAAGPLSDPRRARAARPRRLRPHPHRAARARWSSSTWRCWRPRASTLHVHRRRDRPHRRLRDARERAHREHRRAPAAHRHGEAARRGLVRGAGPGRARSSRSTRPTSTACSPTSSATKICRATSCDAHGGSVQVRGGRALRVLALARRRAWPHAARRGRRSRRCGWCPAPVSDVTVRRVGDDVQLRFKLPTANANGPGRIDLDRVEIYAVTVAPGTRHSAKSRSADEDLRGGNDSGQAAAGRRRGPAGRRIAARYPSESGRRGVVHRGTDRSADDAGSAAEGPGCRPVAPAAGIAANHAASPGERIRLARASLQRARPDDDRCPPVPRAAGSRHLRRPAAASGNGRAAATATSGASGPPLPRSPRAAACSGADHRRSHLRAFAVCRRRAARASHRRA